MDLKLEVVVLPVSDVDRAKDFYKRLGFREDIDYAASNGYFLSGVDNTPLHALQDGVDGASGVYRYGGVAFPNSTFNSNNYWVDVVFVPQ